MARLLLAGTVLVVLIATVASATDPDCVPEGADPSTYLTIDLTPVGGSIYYSEEQDSALPSTTVGGRNVVVPMGGFLTGNGTWVWEEANDLPGLQRAYPSQDFPPGCTLGADLDLSDGEIPCLFFELDPKPADDTCGHGWDRLLL